jgi:hypothetical protein
MLIIDRTQKRLASATIFKGYPNAQRLLIARPPPPNGIPPAHGLPALLKTPAITKLRFLIDSRRIEITRKNSRQPSVLVVLLVSGEQTFTTNFAIPERGN